MRKVNVLLSSYNGEKYIDEQMKSLINQTYKNIDIYVHDDGSSDNTHKILEKYIGKSFEGIRVIEKQLNTGLKYPKCFVEMLKIVDEADYYAFCDQDDLWHADKIERAINALENVNICPKLYYSAVNYCNDKLEYIRGARFSDREGGCTVKDIYSMLLGGEAMGMTFCFDEYARKALIMSTEYTDQFKDLFLKIYCAACGGVIYDSTPTAEYRRHAGAVTVSSNPSGKVERYISEAKNIFINNENFEHIRLILCYILSSPVNLDCATKKYLKLFSKISIINQIKKVFYPKRFRKHLIDELGYRFAMLIGRI